MADEKTKAKEGEDTPKDDEPVIAPGQSAKLAEMGIYQPYNEAEHNPNLFNPKESDEHKEYRENRAHFGIALPSEKAGTASQAK